MNDIIEGLTFSEDALPNRALFLSGLNDINIYVEDVGKEYEYEEIFERLFDGTLNIFSIFPLGGKDAVIRKHQSSNLHDSNGKLNIFIVDGDFDNLWDDQKVLSPNLIYLTRYNIESYYCDKEAVIKYMRSFLKCTRGETEQRIRFDVWRQFFKAEAGQLFLLFALVNRHCPQIPNVTLSLGTFLDTNGHVPVDELEKYKETVSAQVGQTEPLIEEICEKIHSKFDGIDEEKILSIICGKYQFESLCRQLKTRCNKNINRENFRSSLISNFDVETLFFLKNQILQLLANDYLENNSA